MADRYWVGGTGTWNTTSTTNWSATSGGASGASVPTTADNVIFDQAGTYTVTMTGALACLNITVSAGVVTLNGFNINGLTVAGSWSTIAGTVWSQALNMIVTFTSTTARTITSGGVQFPGRFRFNGAGGTWTLQDNIFVFTLVQHIAGTLELGSFTLSTSAFSSFGSEVRTINFGTGNITLNNNSSSSTTIWDTSENTNLTISGTPLVITKCSGASTNTTMTLNAGALSEANSISFQLNDTGGPSTSRIQFSVGSVVRNLTLNGSMPLSTPFGITIYGNYTYISGTITATAYPWTFAGTSGTKTISTGAATHDLPFTLDGAGSTFLLDTNLTLGGTRVLTLTNGTFDQNAKTITSANTTVVTGSVTVNNLNINSLVHTSGTLTLGTDATVLSSSFSAGTLQLGSFTLTTRVFSSSGSGVRTLNFGTGKIVLNSSTTGTIWDTSTITNLTISGTPLVECIGGGTGVTKIINTGALSEANSISFSLLETTGTVTYTFTAGNTVRNLVINGVQTISNIAITIYGNFTHTTTNGTTTFNGGTPGNVWTFAGTSGSSTITTGSSYSFGWVINGVGKSWTFLTGLNIQGAGNFLRLSNGTVDFNNQTIVITLSTIQFNSGTTVNISNLNTNTPISLDTVTLNLLSDVTTPRFLQQSGTLNLNSYTLFCTANNSDTNFSCTGTNTRAINFGTGSIRIQRSGTTSAVSFNIVNATGLTISGTPLVVVEGNNTANRSITLDIALTGTRAISFQLNPTGGSVDISSSNVGSPAPVRNLTVNGTFTLTNTLLSIFGNYTYTSGTLTAGTNGWTFSATSGSYNVNFGGVTHDFPFTFGSTSASTAVYTFDSNITIGSTRAVVFNSGTWDFNNKTVSTIASFTLQSQAKTFRNTGGTTVSIPVSITNPTGNLTLETNLTTSGTYTHTAGTLSLGSFTLTATSFSSSGTSVRTINFGTGQLLLTGNNATIFDITTITSLTISGTVYINSTYTGAVGTRTFSIGAISEATAAGFNVSTSGTSGVVIGASSDTVALTGPFNNFDLTGFTGSLSNTLRTIYGNFTIPASGGTFTSGANATTFSGAGTELITTNGRTLGFPITVNGTGTTRLADALTLSSTLTTTLTAGTLDLNGFTLTTGAFSSSGSGVRTLAFGTGQLALALNGATIFTVETATNFSTTGTVYVNSTYTGATGTRRFVTGFTPAQAAGYDVKTSGSTGIVIGASSDTVGLIGNFNDFDLTGFTGTLVNDTRTLYGNLTIPASGGTLSSGTIGTTLSPNGTKTIDTNGRLLDFPITIAAGSGTSTLSRDLTIGSTRTLTLTSGTFDLNNFVASAQTFSSSNSNARTLAFGSSGEFRSSASGVTIWDTTTGTNFVYTGTPKIFASYAGATGTRTFSFGSLAEAYTFNIKFAATAQTDAVTIATSTDTVSISGNIKDLDLTNSTNTFGANQRTIYGNFTVPAAGGSLTTTTFVTTFAGSSGTCTITTNGRSIPIALTFNGTGRTFQLAGALTSTQALILTGGTLDLNNLTFTATTFASSSASVRSILFGTTGQITVTSSNATLVDISTGTNFSWTGTSKIVSTYASSVGTRTFNIGGTAAIDSAYAFDVIVGTGSGINLSASATDTVALTGIFNNVDLRGFIGILSNTARSIAGNFYIRSTGGTYTAGASVTTFIGNTTTYTVDTATRVLDFPFTFNGSATWNIANNFTSGSSATVSTRTLTLTSGNVSFGSVQINCGLFSSTNSNARNLDFGASGRILLLNSVTSTLWDTTIGTNFSWTGNFDVDCNFTGAITKTINFGTIAEPYAPNVKVATAGTGFGLNTTSATESVALLGNMGNLDLTSFAGILTNAARNVYGNLTFPASGGTFTPGASATTLAATSGTETITYNGRTIQFPLTINGTGGTFVANGNILLSTANTLTLTNGHFNANLANIVASTITISTGNAAVSNLSTTLTVTHTSGNLNLNSNVSTRIYTLSSGNVNLDIYTLNCTTFTSTTSTTRAINFGTGNILIKNTVGGVIWNTGTITNLSTSGPGAVIISNSGSTASTITPGSLSESNSINFIFNTGTYAATITAGSVKNLDFTGFSGSLLNTVTTVYGDLLISTGMSLTAGASAVTFANTSSQNITSNGKTFDFPITFNVVTGTVNLLDNLTVGNTRTTTLTSGTLNLNDRLLRTGLFSSTNTNARSIGFANTGKIQLIANTAVTYWNTASPTNFSYTGNSNIETASSGAVTKTINTGAILESQAMNWNILDTAGTVAFTSGNSVRDLNLNGAFTLSNIPITIYGDYVYTSATALTAGTNAWTFAGEESSYINGGGVTHDFPWTILKSSDLILQGTTTIGSTRKTTYNKGVFDLNGYNYTTGLFEIGYSSDSSVPSSVYLDGTDDYLFVQNNQGFNFGSGDFTVECFVYPTSVTDPEAVLVSLYGYTNDRRSWYMGISDSTLELRWSVDGAFLASINSAPGVFVLNSWHHVAFVRNGSSIKGFVNGVEVISTTFTQSLYTNTTDPVSIGVTGPTYVNNSEFAGYISNVRIVKGTAVYTSSFTPVLLPLTAIANTTLLTCKSSIFIDESPYKNFITVNGTPTINSFTPFLYNSVFFDGTSFLSAPASTNFEFPGDFTIEGWMYFTNTARGSPQALFSVVIPGAEFDVRWYTNRWQVSLNAGSGTDIGSTPAPANDAWTHVACVRSGSAIRLYVNGVATSTTLTNSSTLGYATSVATVGAKNNGSNIFTGYISNIRVVNGTALYTSNFTPSNTPLTAIANTSLLTCQSSDIRDNSNNNFTITTNGIVYVSGLNPFVSVITPEDKTLQFSNGGTITITGTGANTFNNKVTEGIDTEVSNGNALISMTSSSAKAFLGNNSNYSSITLNQGGTGTLTVTGNNSFKDISASITSSANTTILLTAGTTTTVNNFTLSGTASFEPTLNSTVEGSRAIIFRATGANTIHSGADYIICRNIEFTPYSIDGSDYLRWWVGANSSSLNNNRGAVFQTYDANTSPKVYIVEANTAWTVPDDFNVSNNTIHMFGAGGAGAPGLEQYGTTRQTRGGGGGGGGGYTLITNLYAQKNQKINLEVGLGGNDSLQANGGNTKLISWYGVYNAGGGQGAGNGLTGLNKSAGGVGGSGLTYNGGTGGSGSVNAGLTYTFSGGGGGAGAGGPLGNGGNGGNGAGISSSLSDEPSAGGGGGGNGGGTAGSNGIVTNGSTPGTGGSGGNNAIGFGRGIGTTGNPSSLSFSGGGGAGAGSTTSTGSGDGSTGIDVLNSFGGGSGSGGGASKGNSISRNTGIAGNYGAGGGGGGASRRNVATTTYLGDGSSGANGGIIIVYKPSTIPSSNGSFFSVF